MEVKDIRLIEIIHTLEKVEAVNKAIQFHKTTAVDTDELALEQYAAVKKQLTEQLVELLEEMDLHLRMEAA
jgi:hypothetical protein